jgi:hypothetical protein
LRRRIDALEEKTLVKQRCSAAEEGAPAGRQKNFEKIRLCRERKSGLRRLMIAEAATPPPT